MDMSQNRIYVREEDFESITKELKSIIEQSVSLHLTSTNLSSFTRIAKFAVHQYLKIIQTKIFGDFTNYDMNCWDFLESKEKSSGQAHEGSRKIYKREDQQLFEYEEIFDNERNFLQMSDTSE